MIGWLRCSHSVDRVLVDMMKGLRCPTADLERRQTSELHRITLMYDANGVTSISELGEFHRHSIVFDV